MPTAKWSTINKTQVCSGDLRNLIEIQTRRITAPDNPLDVDTVDASETFNTIYTTRAAISTPKGYKTFDEVGTTTQITHYFFVRYLNDISTDNWILFEGLLYRILQVTDFESRKIFMRLDTTLRGPTEKVAVDAENKGSAA
jgi:SPP1 family predicted phage head-tail adaptor